MSLRDLNKWESMGAHCQDPITMAVVATGFQAISAIQQGNAAKAEADYQAKIASQNADIAAAQTEAAKDKQDRERRLRMGAMRAGAGASGVGSESFGDIISSSAMQEELDLLTIESEGLLTQRDYQAQSSLLKTQGKNAQTSGYMTAGAKVLGGASQIYGAKTEDFGRTQTGTVPKPPKKPARYS